MSAIVLLAASCNNIAPEPVASGNEVCFVAGVESRATVITKENIASEGSSFRVFGDIKSDKEDSPLIQFNDCKVSYKDGKWQYDGDRFWIPGYQHSFVAVHPANANCLSDIQYSNNQLKFTYTQPADYRKADDLLVAAHRRNYTGGKTSAVQFRFAHILSNINIQVSYTNPNADAVPLQVNSVVFKNIPFEATYGITPAKLSGSNTMTSDYLPEPDSFEGWTITGRDNLTIEFTEADDDVRYVPAGGEPHKLLSNSNALLLLPNPTAPTELVFSYTTFDTDGSHYNTDRLTIPQGWRPGLNYILSLTVTNGKVEFSIEVAPWEQGKTTNTTVPR